MDSNELQKKIQSMSESNGIDVNSLQSFLSFLNAAFHQNPELLSYLHSHPEACITAGVSAWLSAETKFAAEVMSGNSFRGISARKEIVRQLIAA